MDGEWVAALLKEGIARMLKHNPQAEIVQVVGDNAAVNWKAFKMLEVMDEYRHITFTGCAAHVLDLALEKLDDSDYLNHVISSTLMVALFFRNVTWAMIELQAKTKGKGLMRHAATRFGTNLLMVARLHECKTAVKEVVNGGLWQRRVPRSDRSVRAKAEEVMSIVNEHGEYQHIWAKLKVVADIMGAVMEPLRLADALGGTASKMYTAVLGAVEKLEGYAMAWGGAEGREAEDAARVVKEVWHNKDRFSAIYGAARLLDPTNYGVTPPDDAYTTHGWIVMLGRMYHN